MKIINNILEYNKKSLYLPLLSVVLLGLSFIVDKPMEVFQGYFRLFTCNSILITDYIKIAGLGATLFNVSTIMIFNLFMINRMNLKISGIVFSGILVIAGFSFFGKNLFNTLPIYFGIYIYSLIKKIKFKVLIITILFSTGISPLISYTMFGFGFPLYFSIPLGVFVGLIVGIVLPALASHTIKFHQGYNLFNTGFALGLISVAFYGVFTSLGWKVKTELIISTNAHNFLLGLIFCISTFYIVVALIQDRTCINKYIPLCKRSGRLISDFVRDFSKETVMLNFGLIGMLSLMIIFIFKIPINGAVVGTLLTIMGFASAGIHLKNAIPVILGAVIGVYLTNGSFQDTSTSLSLFFVVALAPIAGRYGVLIGVFSGIVHIMITPLMITFQGGFDLYNNGFSAGFVACIIIVTIEAFKNEETIIKE